MGRLPRSIAELAVVSRGSQAVGLKFRMPIDGDVESLRNPTVDVGRSDAIDKSRADATRFVYAFVTLAGFELYCCSFFHGTTALRSPENPVSQQHPEDESSPEMRLRQGGTQRGNTLGKEAEATQTTTMQFSPKETGVRFKDSARKTICDLGVPEENVDAVIHAVATAFGSAGATEGEQAIELHSDPALLCED
ncbi:hypothetical protein LshimejAT787_1202010 [Lyophyllum shimeji]|uniref:Uncharacterized protein n=1 Tax=Lyophyllum shimeji TaxID=47721 RepID=A0A9P3PWW4_LYOSH|nr:hypothetical protein LshimejAT787_1202010 [Lyophyllum shimeji]